MTSANPNYTHSQLSENKRKRRHTHQPAYLWNLQIIVAIIVFAYLLEVYAIGINTVTPFLGIGAIALSIVAAVLNMLHSSLPLLLINIVLTIALIVHVSNLLF